MMKKMSTIAFFALVTMATTESLADDPVIGVSTFVVQGSVWDTPDKAKEADQGSTRIDDQIKEAIRIGKKLV